MPYSIGLFYVYTFPQPNRRTTMINITEPNKCIIKIGGCPTLSGKETLTYHVGSDDHNALYFRVVANSGNGFFNKDWLALSDIQECFNSWPVDSTITSFTIWSLLKGKSSNTSAFILAALKHEGIVATLKGKRRNHEYIEPEEFLEAWTSQFLHSLKKTKWILHVVLKIFY